MRIVWLPLVLALSACKPEASATSEKAFLTEAELEQAVAECRASGREPVVHFADSRITLERGLPICDKRTADGGDPCSEPADCETTCLPTTKTCAAGYIAVEQNDDENLDFFASVKPNAEE